MNRCLFCKVSIENSPASVLRPVWESVEVMRQAGRTALKRVGVKRVAVLPALCPGCQAKRPRVAFKTNWQRDVEPEALHG